MEKIRFIRELNEGAAHLVELSNKKKLIISWEQEDDDRVDFRFYEDNTEDENDECNLENKLTGQFIFKDVHADEDYPRAKTGYKIIYMYAPAGYVRMGIGEYIIKWFLKDKDDCSHIYASDPYDLTIKDGSEITGSGLKFLKAMQGLELIQDPYKED